MTTIPFKIYNHTKYPLAIKDCNLISNDITLQLYPDSITSTININTQKTSYQLYKIKYDGNASEGNDAGKGTDSEDKITLDDKNIDTNEEAFINCAQLNKVQDVVKNNVSDYFVFKNITYNTTNFYYALYLFEMTHLDNSTIINTGSTGSTGGNTISNISNIINSGSTGSTGGNIIGNNIDVSNIIGNNGNTEKYNINTSSICYYIAQIPVAYKVSANVVKIDQRLGPLEFFYKIYSTNHKSNVESSISTFQNLLNTKYSTRNGNNDIHLLSYQNTNVLYTRLNLYKEYSTLIRYLYYKLRYNLGYINISDSSSYESDLCWITDSESNDTTLDYYKNIILPGLRDIDIYYEKIILIRKRYTIFNNCIKFVNKFNDIIKDYEFQISTKSVEWKDKLGKTYTIIEKTHNTFTKFYTEVITKTNYDGDGHPLLTGIIQDTYNNNVKYKKIIYYLSVLTYIFDKADYLFITEFYENWQEEDYGKYRKRWPITSYAYLNKYFRANGTILTPKGNIQDVYELKIKNLIIELLVGIGVQIGTTTNATVNYSQLKSQIDNLNRFEYNGSPNTLFLSTDNDVLLPQLDTEVKKDILTRGLALYFTGMGNGTILKTDGNKIYYYEQDGNSIVDDLPIAAGTNENGILAYTKNIADAKSNAAVYLYDGGYSPALYDLTDGEKGSINEKSMQYAIYKFLDWIMANYIHPSLNEVNNIDQELLEVYDSGPNGGKLKVRERIEQIINSSENTKNEIKQFVMCRWNNINFNNPGSTGIVCRPGDTGDNIIIGNTGNLGNNIINFNTGMVLIDFTYILYFFELSDIYNNNKYTIEYFKEYVKNYHAEFNDIAYQCAKYGYRITLDKNNNYTPFIEKRWDLYRTYINPIESYESMTNKSPEMYVDVMNNNIISTMVYIIGYVNCFMNSYIFSNTSLQTTYYNYLRNSKFILQKCMDEISTVVNEHYTANTKTYKTLLLNNRYKINYIKEVNEAHQYNYFKCMLLYINKTETSNIIETDYIIAYGSTQFVNTVNAINRSSNINNLFWVYITNTFIKYITKYNYLNNAAFNYQNKTLPIFEFYYKVQSNTYKTFLDVINLGHVNNLRSYSSTADTTITRISYLKSKVHKDYNDNNYLMDRVVGDTHIDNTRGVDYRKIKIESIVKNIVYSLYYYSNLDNAITWNDFTDKRKFWYYITNTNFSSNIIVYPNWYFGTFNFSTITMDYHILLFNNSIAYFNANSDNNTSSIDNTKLYANGNQYFASIMYNIIIIYYGNVALFLNDTLQLINRISSTNYNKDKYSQGTTGGVPFFMNWSIFNIQKDKFISLFDCGIDDYFTTYDNSTSSISKENTLGRIKDVYSSLVYYSVNNNSVPITTTFTKTFFQLCNSVGKDNTFSFETKLTNYKFITTFSNDVNIFNNGTTEFPIVCIQRGDIPSIYNSLRGTTWLTSTDVNTLKNTFVCINTTTFTNNLAKISIFINDHQTITGTVTGYTGKVNTFMGYFTSHITNIATNPTFSIPSFDLKTSLTSASLIYTDYYTAWNTLKGYTDTTTTVYATITDLAPMYYTSIDKTKVMDDYKNIIYNLMKASDGTLGNKIKKFLLKINIGTTYSAWSFKGSTSTDNQVLETAILSNFPSDWDSTSTGIYSITDLWRYQIDANKSKGDDRPAYWFFNYIIKKSTSPGIYGRSNLDSTSIDYTTFVGDFPKLIIHVLYNIRQATVTGWIWGNYWHHLIYTMDIEYLLVHYSITNVNNYLNNTIVNTTRTNRYYQKPASLAAFDKLYAFYNRTAYTYDGIDNVKINTNRVTIYTQLKNNSTADATTLKGLNLYDYVVSSGTEANVPDTASTIGISLMLIEKDNFRGLYNKLVYYKDKVKSYDSMDNYPYAIFDYAKLNTKCVSIAYKLLELGYTETTLETKMATLRTSALVYVYYRKRVSFTSFGLTVINNQDHVNYFNTNILDTTYLDIRQTVADYYDETEFYTLKNNVIIYVGAWAQTQYTDVTETTQNFFSRAKIEYYLPVLITSWAKESASKDYKTECVRFRDALRADLIMRWNFYIDKSVSLSANNNLKLKAADFYHNYIVEPAVYTISTDYSANNKLMYSIQYKTTIKFLDTSSATVINNLNNGGGNYGARWYFIPSNILLSSKEEYKKYFFIRNEYNQYIYANGYDNTVRRAYNTSGTPINYQADPNISGGSFYYLYNYDLAPSIKKLYKDLSACGVGPSDLYNVKQYLWEIIPEEYVGIGVVNIKSCYGYLGSNGTINNAGATRIYLEKKAKVAYEYSNLVD